MQHRKPKCRVMIDTTGCRYVKWGEWCTRETRTAKPAKRQVRATLMQRQGQKLLYVNTIDRSRLYYTCSLHTCHYTVPGMLGSCAQRTKYEDDPSHVPCGTIRYHTTPLNRSLHSHRTTRPSNTGHQTTTWLVQSKKELRFGFQH